MSQTRVTSGWDCPTCGYYNEADTKQCGSCGGRNPALPPVAPTPSPDATRHGWRLWLPNHVVVPLAEGSHDIGRKSGGEVGAVLCLFPHVSRVHLELNVTPRSLEVYPLPNTNPVFTFDEASGSGTDPREPILVEAGLTVLPGQGRTFCLGQCCFIRIDRGEA